MGDCPAFIIINILALYLHVRSTKKRTELKAYAEEFVDSGVASKG